MGGASFLPSCFCACIVKHGVRITKNTQVYTILISEKSNQLTESNSIPGLQPSDKAVTLAVNSKEFFPKNLHENRF